MSAKSGIASRNYLVTFFKSLYIFANCFNFSG